MLSYSIFLKNTWKKQYIHVIYHTDKQLSNNTDTLDLKVDLCLRLSLASDSFFISACVNFMWDIQVIVH